GVLSHGDRVDLDLPGEQEALLKAVAATGTPVILVLLNGSALAVNWADEHIPAILEAWYPGQAGGRAVAEALFGDTNPGGRLPVTFYRSVEQLPPFDDYRMVGRTYRYFDGDVLYPFGFGLSYTTFGYHNLFVSPNRIYSPEVLRVSCEVHNTGSVAGDEVVQVYLRHQDASVPVPRHSLVGFRRVHLEPGAVERLTFEISPRQYAIVTDLGQWAVEPGVLTIFVGGGQPGFAQSLSANVELFCKRILLAN
ncbi:MAG: glycoside hydrolase family 3 C-terminal domain-containing protein, partial [Brevefilum sp.]|nr:glycoside hydrolase family 3 C-terminal domain-containing protein [Brevefilum sp.]